jgi:polyisoprenoid-binding protein YceI
MNDNDDAAQVPVRSNDGSQDGSGGGIPRWVKFTVLGLIGLVVLFFGAIFLYAKVLNDSPDEFTEADLDAALSAEADDGTGAPQGSVATGEPPLASAPSAATDAPPATDAATSATTSATNVTDEPATAASTWAATDASQVGYRVDEVLFGVNTTAVGRTNQVQGALAIDGTSVTGVEFTVDVGSISSDESRRDNQFRGRIMTVDEFPTATFVLTQPIELGVEATEGATVTAQATGDLTLRGVTNPVTFEVNAKRENDLIGVQGAIPVLFEDFGIANPSTGGITTEDNGLVEFVLVFEPA